MADRQALVPLEPLAPLELPMALAALALARVLHSDSVVGVLHSDSGSGPALPIAAGVCGAANDAIGVRRGATLSACV